MKRFLLFAICVGSTSILANCGNDSGNYPNVSIRESKTVHVDFEITTTSSLSPAEGTAMRLVNGVPSVPDDAQFEGFVGLKLSYGGRNDQGLIMDRSANITMQVMGTKKEKGFTVCQCEGGGEIFLDSQLGAKPLIRAKDLFSNVNIKEKMEEALSNPSKGNIFYLWQYSYEYSLKQYLAEFDSKDNEGKIASIQNLSNYWHPLIDEKLKNVSKSPNEELATAAKEVMKAKGIRRVESENL